MTRVADYAQHQRIMSLISVTQNYIDDRQTQAASGVKSQDYKGIATVSEQLVNLENSHVQVSRYQTNNQTVLRRLQQVESSIAQIHDIGSQFKTLLVNALNAQNGQDLALSTQAQDMLDQVGSLLNVDDAGHYLFAGNRTNTEPVDLSQLPPAYAIPSSDGDAGAYYTGDSTKAQVRADNSLTLTYGVTADEQGFERLIRAIDVVRKAAPSDRDSLDHALDLVNQALDNISDIRTRVGTNMSTLDTVNTKHDAFLQFTEQQISDLKNVDVAQTVTEMNNAQVNLQASYMTLARLAQNSLLKYLG